MPGSPYESSPEDLYRLGIESGYITPDNADTSNTAPLPGEALGRHFATGPGEGLTPPTAPILPGYPGEEGTTREAGGIGMAGKSFNPDKYKQLSKTDAELQRGLDSADATARAAGAPLEGAAGMAHDSGVEAAHGMAKSHAEEVSASGRAATLLQGMYDGFAADEAKINAGATALSNQAKADYMAALVDLRASRVDPQQLWHTQSTGMQIGMLAAAFAHDFLGAKGIKTSAMDSLNRAIENNINSQVQAIKTKGEVAEGFKSLWYMQRNQSASDAEARARVKGFLLDSAKQAVVAYMAPYESALATAQGQAAVAKIDEEFAKNMIDVYKHIDGNSIALKNQAIERWKTKINAANESWKISIEQEKLNMAKKAALLAEQNNVIINPETNKGAWAFRPRISEKEQETTRSIIFNKNVVRQGLNDLRELMRKAQAEGKVEFDPIQGTRFAGTYAQEYDALAKRMAHGMVHANGERATDQDVKDYIKGIRPDTILDNAEAEKVLAFTERSMMRETDAWLQQVAVDLPEGDPRRSIEGAKGSAFAGTNAEASNTASPPEKSSEEKQHETYVKQVVGPTGPLSNVLASPDMPAKSRDTYFKEAPADSENAAVKADHERFITDYWGIKTGVGGIQGEEFYKKSMKERAAAGDYGTNEVRNFEAGLHGLKEEAIGAKDPEVRNKALSQLARQAAGYLGTGDASGDQEDYKGAFALMMLHDVAMELGQDKLDDKDTIQEMAKEATK